MNIVDKKSWVNSLFIHIFSVTLGYSVLGPIQACTDNPKKVNVNNSNGI